MADFDLDTMEELMRQDQSLAKGGDREDGKHRSKRSGSRSKKKKSHKHKHSKDRHKDKHKRKHRSRSYHSVDGSEKSESKKKPKPEEELIDPVKKQQEALMKQIEEAKKQAEEAQRDDCTVLVSRINILANERDIYSYFAKAGVGKIRDVRLIRDQRSGKSKGIAYIEFYTPESVLLAMGLSGTQLMGQTLTIQASQAEKNRAAAASKFKKEQDRSFTTPYPSSNKDKKQEENNKVYVGGLVDVLNQINESDIRGWFTPFGDIEYIELPKDSNTGRNKGHAIIYFRKHRDAKSAVKEMDGFEINNKKLKVSIITDSGPKHPGNRNDYEIDDDGANSYLHSAQSRALLMQKLSRETDNQDQGQKISSQNYNNQPAVPQFIQSMPTTCLLLNNMFDPNVDLRKEPSFFIDIKDQVIEVCKEMGDVDKVWVEQNSPGNVWVKFSKDHIQGAIKTQQALHNRFFDSRLITVSFVPENVFNSKVKER